MCCHGRNLFQILPSLQAFSGTESWVLCLSSFYFSFGSCVSADVLFLVDPQGPKMLEIFTTNAERSLWEKYLLVPARKVENSGPFLIVVTFENNLHGLVFDTYRMYTLCQDLFFRETVRKLVECLFYSFIIVVIIIFKPQSILLSSSCLYSVLQDKRNECQLHRIGNDQPASLFSVLSVVPLSFVPLFRTYVV